MAADLRDGEGGVRWWAGEERPERVWRRVDLRGEAAAVERTIGEGRRRAAERRWARAGGGEVAVVAWAQCA